MQNTPKLVFIVPYRNRETHLEYFNNHMPTILADYTPDSYKILFIHQCDNRSFNRGAMKNIGFLTVKNMYPLTYSRITLVFNDIDCMPRIKGLFNYETMPGVVKHFYGYKYALGGIVSINAADFERINGFPNFWNWGYEDNMLQKRVERAKIVIDRGIFYYAFDSVLDNANKKGLPIPHINSYPVINHFHGNTRNMNRTEFEIYITNKSDGLANVKNVSYTIDSNTNFVNVTRFDVGYEEDKKTSFEYDLGKGNNPFNYHGGRRQTRMLMNFV